MFISGPAHRQQPEQAERPRRTFYTLTSRLSYSRNGQGRSDNLSSKDLSTRSRSKPMTVKTWLISGVVATLILIPLQNAQAWDNGSGGGRHGGQGYSQGNHGYSRDSGYDRGYRGYEGRGYSGNRGGYGNHGDDRRSGGGYHGGHHGYYGGDNGRRPMDQPER